MKKVLFVFVLFFGSLFAQYNTHNPNSGNDGLSSLITTTMLFVGVGLIINYLRKISNKDKK